MKPHFRAAAVINLSAIAHNTRRVKEHIGGQRLCAVVKADGYGHGAVRAAAECLSNGASRLAVAICEEGIALRQSGIEAPVLVLGYTPAAMLDNIAQYGLTQTVFSIDMARELASAARRNNTRIKTHIKVDTGMSRLGFLPDADAAREVAEIYNMPELETEGIYTHFATSDEPGSGFVYEQKERFDYFLSLLDNKNIRPGIVHLSNSGAVLNYPDIRADMARSGIMLFGLPPANFADLGGLSLLPAMSFVSEISSIKKIAAGASIGYARSFYTKRPSLIATVPVGYADGYPRVLSNKAYVLVNGKKAPIVGNICMDQMMIDVTDISVKPADKVTLLGKNGGEYISADMVADTVGTINYEVICCIGKRVPRVYV